MLPALLRTLAAPCALLLAAGCSQRSHRMGIDLRAADAITVFVDGERAALELRNAGPGRVIARVETTHELLLRAEYTLKRGSFIAQELRCPFRVTLETGGEPARVEFEALGAEGVAFDDLGADQGRAER